MTSKRLYRSERDVKVSGVLAGIAEYAEVDPTLVRLVYVLVTAFSGVFPGVIAYVVLALVIPKASEIKE